MLGPLPVDRTSGLSDVTVVAKARRQVDEACGEWMLHVASNIERVIEYRVAEIVPGIDRGTAGEVEFSKSGKDRLRG